MAVVIYYSVLKPCHLFPPTNHRKSLVNFIMFVFLAILYLCTSNLQKRYRNDWESKQQSTKSAIV